MTLKQLRRILLGITHLAVFETMPSLTQSIRDTVELLRLYEQLQQLVSNMPGIDKTMMMNVYWLEKRDDVLRKINEKLQSIEYEDEA
ncbi:MAG TPA: hypothetical protein VH593_14315 [Ktedonobacteraceae bacterium]